MIHITEYACFHEPGYYTPGDTGAPVYARRRARIGVAICYDRHYPEYMRALAVGRRGSRGRAAGRIGRRVAGRAVRGRDARRGVSERLLRRALQSRRAGREADVRRRVVRLRPGRHGHRAGRSWAPTRSCTPTSISRRTRHRTRDAVPARSAAGAVRAWLDSSLVEHCRMERLDAGLSRIEILTGLNPRSYISASLLPRRSRRSSTAALRAPSTGPAA